MKGHFSVEWLSQSSCAAPAEPVGPCTSSTPSESLPGFYYSRREPRPEEETSITTTSGPSPHSQLQTGSQAEAGFSSGAEEEETSGYESEGGGSPSPAAPPTTASVSPPLGRRLRTAFTAEQISRLEQAFKQNPYLGTHDKAELCRKLNLSDKQIRNWFQNRRMKLKRTLQDVLAQACQAKVASQLVHYPELQGFRPAPYPGYYPAQESSASYLPSASRHAPYPSYYPAQESSAPYLTPASLQYQASPAGAAISPLNMDALYQYNSLQAFVAPPGSAPLVPPYPPYPHHY